MPQKKWYEYFPRMTFVTISVFATYALMVVYDLVMGNALTSTLNQFALVCGYLTSSWLVVVVSALAQRAPKLPAKSAQPDEEGGMSDEELALLLCVVAIIVALAMWWNNNHPLPHSPQSQDDKVIVIPWGG